MSSVYLWDLDSGGFAGVVLIKKAGDGSKKIKVSHNCMYTVSMLYMQVSIGNYQ